MGRHDSPETQPREVDTDTLESIFRTSDGNQLFGKPPIGKTKYRVSSAEYEIFVLNDNNTVLYGTRGDGLMAIERLKDDFMTHEIESGLFSQFYERMKRHNVRQVFYGGTESYADGVGTYLWDCADRIVRDSFGGGYVMVSDQSKDGWTSRQVRRRHSDGVLEVIWEGVMNDKPAFVYKVSG